MQAVKYIDQVIKCSFGLYFRAMLCVFWHLNMLSMGSIA